MSRQLFPPRIFLATVFLMVALVLCSQPVSGQTAVTASTSSPNEAKSDTPRAADVLARAKELYATEGPKVALPEFEKALELFRKDNDKKNEAITLGLIGNCHKRFGDFPKAEDYLRRALAMKRGIGDRLEEGKTLSHLGLLYREMSEYAKAIDHYNQAIAIGQQLGDRILEGSARNNLGLVYDDLGDYRRSLEQYDRALQLYGADFERGTSDALGNIGGVSLLLGEYAKALGYYQQALEIDERNKLKPGIVLDLQNIGLAYTGLGRLTEALQAFDKSISLASEAALKREEADSRKGKGSALLQLARYDLARKEFQQALQVYEQAGLKQELVEGLNDLGNLELRLGDATSAEQHYRRAVDIARAIKHPRGVTVNLIALGDIQWRRKRFNEAAALYRDALARAVEAKDRGSEGAARIQLALTLRSLNQLTEAAKESQLAVQIARATEARLLEAEALYAQGDIARTGGQSEIALKYFIAGGEIATAASHPELSWRFDYGRGQTLEALQRNDEALAAYQAAVKTIEQVRGELREDRFRAGYIEDKYQVYVGLVELLLKIGKTDEAFLFSEKLRARSYLDLLNRSQPPIRNQAQRQKESLLRNRVRELQRKLEEETGKPPRDQRGDAVEVFSKELASAETEYQNFLDDLLSSDPNYAAVRALTVPDVDAVKRQLPPGTALLEYVVGRDRLQIFVVTSDGLHAKSVPMTAAELQGKVEFLRDVMLRKTTADWKPPAGNLHRSLIAPLEDAGWLRGISRLYVVPHAILNYLPFAVLADRTERLVVDNYTLSYLPSAAALIYGGRLVSTSKSALTMAPANTRLRFTQQESRSVAAFFPERRMLLLGARATETSFKRFADSYDVIHLATHGYFNKTNPLLSGVVLEADAENDGRLDVHEILSLRLNAQLVTLSACDTALGSGYFEEFPAGDDLVGLTRAFLFAGSPTVMATLWEVNDGSAVRLMRSFYGELGRSDKATALRNAQRDMRARGVYRHPYYWSAFVMVGEMK